MLQTWVLWRFSFKTGYCGDSCSKTGYCGDLASNWVLWRLIDSCSKTGYCVDLASNWVLRRFMLQNWVLWTFMLQNWVLWRFVLQKKNWVLWRFSSQTGYCGESCSKTWYCGDSSSKTGYCGDLCMNTQSPPQKHLLLALSPPADGGWVRSPCWTHPHRSLIFPIFQPAVTKSPLPNF